MTTRRRIGSLVFFVASSTLMSLLSSPEKVSEKWLIGNLYLSLALWIYLVLVPDLLKEEKEL